MAPQHTGSGEAFIKNCFQVHMNREKMQSTAPSPPISLDPKSKLLILKMQSKEAGKELTKIICNKSESNPNIEKYLNYTFN